MITSGDGVVLWSAAIAGVCEQGQRFDSGSVRLWVEIWVENRRCAESVHAGAAWSGWAHPRTRYPAAGPSVCRCAAVAHRADPRLTWLGAANSGLSLLMQGQAHIAEPRAGDPHPFPPVRGLGGCSDVGQSRVQLRQLEAPLALGLKSPREVASSRSLSASPW